MRRLRALQFRVNYAGNAIKRLDISGRLLRTPVSSFRPCLPVRLRLLPSLFSLHHPRNACPDLRYHPISRSRVVPNSTPRRDGGSWQRSARGRRTTNGLDAAAPILLFHEGECGADIPRPSQEPTQDSQACCVGCSKSYERAGSEEDLAASLG